MGTDQWWRLFTGIITPKNGSSIITIGGHQSLLLPVAFANIWVKKHHQGSTLWRYKYNNLCQRELLACKCIACLKITDNLLNSKKQKLNDSAVPCLWITSL